MSISREKNFETEVYFQRDFFLLASLDKKALSCSVRLTMRTDYCWELGNTWQREEGRGCSVSFSARQVILHSGHEDEGKSFKSAVKLFWYLGFSEGLGVCFLSNFLE